MKFTAADLATLLQGQLIGNAEVTVHKLSKIEEGEPNSVSFLANEQYNEFIYQTNASVVIVNQSFEPERPIKPTCTLIKVPDARMAFAKLLEAYQKFKSNKVGIESPIFKGENFTSGKEVYIGAFTHIGNNVNIGNNVKIFPNCFIGDQVKIGDNTVIKPGVKIMEDCIIGANCTLHPGVIIGGDGFGFAPNSENNYQKIIHTGNVILEDHVEVGANTTIDRATLGSTIIKKGVKLDNLIQIAHNVEIGENTVIAAQTGIAGSTKIGKNCMIGGQVGIVGHLKIADGVKIAAQSGIGQNIETENEIVQGSPAFSIRDYKRSYVLFRNLPDIKNQLDELSKNQK